MDLVNPTCNLYYRRCAQNAQSSGTRILRKLKSVLYKYLIGRSWPVRSLWMSGTDVIARQLFNRVSRGKSEVLHQTREEQKQFFFRQGLS